MNTRSKRGEEPEERITQPRLSPNVARFRTANDRAAVPRTPRIPANVSPQSVVTARRMVRERLRRNHHFDAALFADPAWDMMLDLFIAEAEGRETPVMNLCLSSQVPETTTLRWVKTLEHAGIVIRRKDEHDQRRVLIRLSSEAAKSLAAYLDETS